jgi:hypothetical protein
MNGKISLEEHFGIPETVEASKGPLPAASWNELRARLLDIQDQRVQLMDEHGIEMMLLSLNSPVVQAIPDVKQAVHIARISNDYLAAEIAKRPNRFAGLAAVPLQDPEAAVRELTRCVKDLGFKGVLVNGFSQSQTATLLRPAALSAILAGGRAAKRAVLSAPTSCAATGFPHLRGPSMDDWRSLGVRPRDRGSRATTNGIWAIRQVSAPNHTAGTSRRRTAGRHLASR